MIKWAGTTKTLRFLNVFKDLNGVVEFVDVVRIGIEVNAS